MDLDILVNIWPSDLGIDTATGVGPEVEKSTTGGYHMNMSIMSA